MRPRRHFIVLVMILALTVSAGILASGCVDGPGMTPVPPPATEPMGAPPQPPGGGGAPSNGTGGTPPPEGNGDVVELSISANNQSFSTDTLTAPAGATVHLEFNNEEAVGHNVSLYESSARAQIFFVGEVFVGPATETYTFDAPPEPGEYFFVCDVHPETMTGTFIAE